MMPLGRRGLVRGAGAAGLAATLPAMPAFAGTPELRGNRFDLRLDRVAIDKTGTTDWANAINGGVPGPTLRWQEGDVVTLNVTNNLPELTGLHWHGIILPNPMDGVPGLEFPGIKPGETFTYRFPIVQSGTYWYHSHLAYQEQKGAYGALIIDPAGTPRIRADRDYVVVLSDWMDGSPLIVQNNLKHMSDYYNYNRRTLGTFAAAVRLMRAIVAAACLLLVAVPLRAQTFGSGGRLVGPAGLGSSTLGGASPYGSLIPDDRVYIHGFFDQLEGRIGDGSYLRWDGQGWIGDDYNKLWIKSEGRYNPDNRGRMTDGDHEFLYDRPISRYFDIQAGVRVDLDSGPTRTWAALGIQGLAVGFWNVEATVYASDGGHYALKTNASYDLYLTQRLVLQPQFETNWYTAQDRGRGVGAGLSDIDAGLRLRYDWSRKLSPYLGVAYQRRFGGTESLVRESGGKVSDTRFLVGLRTWF